MNEVENNVIENIYRKFKSYVYYDNTALHLRHQIAEYESDENFEDNLEYIGELLENIDCLTDEMDEYLSDLIDDISVLVVPKRFKKEVDNVDSTCITNSFEKKNYLIDKLNYMINAPIEIHLLVFYWVLKYGSTLEKEYRKHNYGNLLDVKYSNINDSSTKTFKPYFTQYSKWRDSGIKKVQDNHKNNEGSAILMLDVSSYYYNIDFDFDKLDSYFDDILEWDEYSEYEALTGIIKSTFETFNGLVSPLIKGIDLSSTALPIGLSISPIFANYYLSEFDKNIVKRIKPLYYGRYVDDIMIVFSEDSFEDIKFSNPTTSEFVKSNLITNHNVLDKQGDDYIISDESFEIKYHSKIRIQKDKMKLYILDRTGTPAIIENFIENIKRNSSEFRYLPEESKVISEFNKEAYSMLYNDTQNKLRSIEKFSGDKYGVSKYLAKVILTSKYWNDSKEKLDLLVEQIDSFFSGIHCLEYFSLWEKIFTFYVINNRADKINSFYERIIKNISLVQAKGHGPTNGKKLQAFLKKYCELSLTQACSLNLEVISKVKNNIVDEAECVQLRSTNLIRDNYIITPLVNFTKGSNDIKNLLTLNLRCSKDNIDNSKCNICSDCELELDMYKFRFSPRFVHYHELQHYLFFLEAYKYESGYFGSYVEKAQEIYEGINNFSIKRNTQQHLTIEEEKLDHLKLSINNVHIPGNKKQNKLRIGVASIKVDSSNIEKSYLKIPNLSRERFNSLVKLINYIELTKSDVIVLPEVSVPFAWIGILTQFARRQQKCIIFGLEHIINRNNVALNLLATVLPYRVNGLNYSFLKLRLKNHYSPDEERLLKGYRYNLPVNIQMAYDLFYWNGCRFACFNCFELADIQHRSYFRSKVDFLTASEYNRDTNYFSNIVESVSRDIHCYFIQSNSSDFGDSRITKPSKSYEKDLVKLKGGINDQVVVGEIDIHKLRKFQYKEYELQKDDKSFKPTPPNFDKKEIEKILSD